MALVSVLGFVLCMVCVLSVLSVLIGNDYEDEKREEKYWWYKSGF